MERDDAEPPAGGQAAENRLHPLVQGIQFPIDGNPHCLEAAAGGVLVLAALGRRHSGCNQVRKLQSRQNRGFLPCFHDFTRNLPGIRFLTIIAQDAGQFLTVQGVHQVCRGGPLLAHAHIQRGIRVIGEATLGIVQLVAGNAKVQQRAVDEGDLQFIQHAGGFAEVGLNHLGG